MGGPLNTTGGGGGVGYVGLPRGPLNLRVGIGGRVSGWGVIAHRVGGLNESSSRP